MGTQTPKSDDPALAVVSNTAAISNEIKASSSNRCSVIVGRFVCRPFSAWFGGLSAEDKVTANTKEAEKAALKAARELERIESIQAATDLAEYAKSSWTFFSKEPTTSAESESPPPREVFTKRETALAAMTRAADATDTRVNNARSAYEALSEGAEKDAMYRQMERLERSKASVERRNTVTDVFDRERAARAEEEQARLEAMRTKAEEVRTEARAESERLFKGNRAAEEAARIAQERASYLRSTANRLLG